MSDTQLAERPANSVKEYLSLPAYRDRFHEVMGKRAPQFMAAIVSLSQSPNLKEAEPKSVIAAAMVAATLDLPVNPTLGMAHVVSYRDKNGQSIAQFQCGYKGFIQLALRSGQYRRLNAGPVNAEVFKGYDMVGEPMLDWTQLDPTKPTAGYFCAFEMLNGFTKVVYWPRAQVEAHAKRFSKAYQKGYQSSPWFSDFDSMATKTVIKNAITKWGVLSVEMQKAAVHDQAAQKDVDAEPEYIDGQDEVNVTPESEAPANRPAPKPRQPKGAAAVVENRTPAAAEKVAQTIEAEIVPPEEVKAAQEAPANEPAKEVQHVRATLNDGETYETTLTVETVSPLIANLPAADGTRKPTPSVRVKGRGGFIGEFYHFGGATGEGENLKPAALWTVGNAVKVKLSAKKNAKGNIIVRVEEAVAGNAAIDVE